MPLSSVGNSATVFEPTDFRINSPRFATDARAANLALVDLLKRVAELVAATEAVDCANPRHDEVAPT